MKLHFLISLIVACITSASFGPTFILAQSSSGSYKIQSDSINFAGGASASNSYNSESTLGENATGKIDSANYGLHDAGFQNSPGAFSTLTAPLNVISSAIASDRILVRWDAPLDPTGVVGYYLYRNNQRIDSVQNFPRDYVDSGLAASTAYSYNVSAFDALGSESPRSATSTATTFASLPPSSRTVFVTNLSIDPIISIVPNDTQALVSFDTTNNVAATIFWGTDLSYGSGSQTENTLDTAHRFVLKDLLPSTLYYLKIKLVTGGNKEVIYENIQFVTLAAPLIKTVPNVRNFQIIPQENEINLTWSLPVDKSVYGVRVVRSTSFYPYAPIDGKIIFEDVDGKGIENFVDTNVQKGTQYYYTIFTFDLSKNFSSGVVGSGKIALPGDVVATSTPVDTIPFSNAVDPKIAALEMKDFLFIQNGNSIAFKDNKVTVRGDQNMSVVLTYYRVPEVLKTILVTLVTKETTPQSFTFILRANKDRTRFESTIGPLGHSGTYDIKITVVDYKNQGQKKIFGTLTVTNSIFDSSLPAEPKTYLSTRWIFGLLILLIILLLAEKFIKSVSKKFSNEHV